MADNQEITTKKMKETTEHGQILMSINNLFQKCQERKDLIISKEVQANEAQEFNNINDSSQNAINQLTIIKQCLENFGLLSNALKDKASIQEKIKIKKENNEIV